MHIVVPAAITEVSYVGANLLWKDNGTSFRFSVAINTSIVTGKEMYDAFTGGRWSNEDWLYGFTSGVIVAGINYVAHETLKIGKRKKRKFDPDLIK